MMPITLRNLTAAAAAAALLAAPSAVSMAKAQSTQQQSTQQSAPQKFSDEELKAFAAASLEVESLNEKWQPQIAGASGQEEQKQVRNQAMQEMAQAVRDEGLTVEEYNQIVGAMQADPNTARSVQEYRAELQ